MTTICKNELLLLQTELKDVVDAVIAGQTVHRFCPSEPAAYPWVEVTCVDGLVPRDMYRIGENPREAEQA